MNQKQVGNKADNQKIVIRNVDTVTVLAGAPVFYKVNATSPGRDVVNGPSGIISMFAGIATADIPVNGFGYAISEGYVPAFRVPAAATGTAGDNFIPTAGSAGVYSSAAGAATALTPRLLILNTLIAGAAENARAVGILSRR